MVRVLASLVAFVCLALASAAQAENATGVAVLIGNRTYQNTDIPAVAYAERDAEAMKRYVLDVLGFSPDNVIDLRDATKGQIEAVFGNRSTHKGRLYQYVTPGRSDVVVYYSGHGIPGLNDGQGYLMPSDAAPTTAEIGGYPIELMYANLGKIAARSTVVFIDACFSGGSSVGPLIRSASPIFIRPVETRVPSGVSVLTAASGAQLASWDNDAKHGLFTHHLLDALYGKADDNGDGALTVAEVRAYLDRTLTPLARRKYNREQTATVLAPADTVLVHLPPGGAGTRPQIALPEPETAPSDVVPPPGVTPEQLAALQALTAKRKQFDGVYVGEVSIHGKNFEIKFRIKDRAFEKISSGNHQSDFFFSIADNDEVTGWITNPTHFHSSKAHMSGSMSKVSGRAMADDGMTDQIAIYFKRVEE